jgi:uncharacterized protein (TIGR00304 family)
MFILAGALIGLAVQSGEAEVGIFLIFPFIVGGGVLMGLGMLFVIIGLVLLVLGMVRRLTLVPMDEMFEDDAPRKASSRRRTRGDQPVKAKGVLGGMKGGGVVFIGPIPIVFGSGVKVTKGMLWLAIVLVLALCLLFFALSFHGF